jgi:hypothetical protein
MHMIYIYIYIYIYIERERERKELLFSTSACVHIMYVDIKNALCSSCPISGLPDFSWYCVPKREQIYQITTKCLYQIAVNIPNSSKYTKRPKYTKVVCLGIKIYNQTTVFHICRHLCTVWRREGWRIQPFFVANTFPDSTTPERYGDSGICGLLFYARSKALMLIISAGFTSLAPRLDVRMKS